MKVSLLNSELKISPNSVNNYIENNYPLLGRLKKLEKIDSGPNTEVFYLLTQKGDFTLRKFNENISTKRTEKIGEILNFCHKSGVNVMEPIYNSKNKFVDPLNRIYLTKFYFGNVYSGKISQLKSFSKNLALLHKLLNKNFIKKKIKFTQESNRILTKKEIYEIQKRIKSSEKSFDKVVSTNFSLLLNFISEDENTGKKIKKLKFRKQLIHHDLHENNVIFKGSKVSAIIDFFSMKEGYLLEDISFSCYRFSLYQNEDIKKIQRMIKIFVDEYNLVYPVAEKDLLYLDFFFRHELLKRISKILRDYYFCNENKWISDFSKHMNLLKMAQLVGNPLISK